MIRDYKDVDIESIKKLGEYLNGSFDISKISENEKIYVYIEGELVIGFIVFSKIYEVADLTYIVVHPDYRRVGVGRRLLMKVLEDVIIERVMLEVRESNKDAIEFYKNNGFSILRIITNYYSNGENAISMERRVR